MRELERRRAIQVRLCGMTSTPGVRVDPLPTGFAALDAALGTGGLPRGRVVELYGGASCGKTAFALQIAAHAQQGGGAAWIDAEHAFDGAFAAQLGVNVPGLPVAKPATAEEALEMARRFAESGAVDLIVIDSAAALVPRLETEADLATTGGGLQSRVMGSELRRLARTAARSRACVLLLNQTRALVDSAGGPETSSGGPALKLHASVRIAMSAKGRRVRFRILKNQLAAPFTAFELRWAPGSGFADTP